MSVISGAELTGSNTSPPSPSPPCWTLCSTDLAGSPPALWRWELLCFPRHYIASFKIYCGEFWPGYNNSCCCKLREERGGDTIIQQSWGGGRAGLSQ